MIVSKLKLFLILVLKFLSRFDKKVNMNEQLLEQIEAILQIYVLDFFPSEYRQGNREISLTFHQNEERTVENISFNIDLYDGKSISFAFDFTNNKTKFYFLETNIKDINTLIQLLTIVNNRIPEAIIKINEFRQERIFRENRR